MQDTLGDRIKRYEAVSSTRLMRRTPVIMRLDGKAFHTYVKQFAKPELIPYVSELHQAMVDVSTSLLKEIQGAKIVYTQSDEISVLITDFDKFNTEAFFDYSVQKMSSVGASIATAHFNRMFIDKKPAFFDCRVFNVPKEDVKNYFLWRQRDWVRNSISLYARHFYSHNQCHNMSTRAKLDMINAKGANWEHLDYRWKYGTTVIKDQATPVCKDFLLMDYYFNEFLYNVEQ